MTTWASLKASWNRINARDSALRRLDGPVLYWITTLALVLVIGVTVIDLTSISIDYSFLYTVKGDMQIQGSIERQSLVYSLADVNKIVPDLKSKLPPGMQSEGTLPVSIAVDQSSGASIVLGFLSTIPLDTLIISVVWLLRRMVLSTVGKTVSEANPFVWANVRRLRTIAVMVLLAPAIGFWSQVAKWELVSRSISPDITKPVYDASLWPLEFGVGLLLLILAEVFAIGIRLRDDVEGLV